MAEIFYRAGGGTFAGDFRTSPPSGRSALAGESTDTRFLRVDVLVGRLQQDVSRLEAKIDDLRDRLTQIEGNLDRATTTGAEVKRQLHRKLGTGKALLIALISGLLVVGTLRPDLLAYARSQIESLVQRFSAS